MPRLREYFFKYLQGLVNISSRTNKQSGLSRQYFLYITLHITSLTFIAQDTSTNKSTQAKLLRSCDSHACSAPFFSSSVQTATMPCVLSLAVLRRQLDLTRSLAASVFSVPGGVFNSAKAVFRCFFFSLLKSSNSSKKQSSSAPAALEFHHSPQFSL